MAKTGTFLVTDEWQEVKLGGGALVPGHYLLENISSIYVALVLSTAMPSPSNITGHAFIMDRKNDSHSTAEFNLIGADVLYARTATENVRITIIQSL